MSIDVARITLLALAFIGTAATAAPALVPQRLRPYFDENDFTRCLAGAIAGAHDPRTLHRALDEISARRQAYPVVTGPECTSLVDALCTESGLSVPTQVKRWLKPVGCYALKEIKVNLMHHSDALFDCVAAGPRPGDGRLYDLLYRWELARVESGSNVNQRDDVAASLRPAIDADHRFPLDPPTTPVSCLLYRAQPLIQWLIEQKSESVSHWELFAKARQIYGDPFEALAVIGQLFDSERQSCVSRAKGCLLGNRLRPLFKPGTTKYRNPVGDNYHFWAQLNAGLTESGVKNKVAAYALEHLKDDDSGEYSANVIGIDVGASAVEAAREALGRPAAKKPTIDCPLGPP